MGRQDFHDVSYGKDASEAFQSAHDRALAEYGHQEGYSGTIYNLWSFVLFQVPPRMTVAKLVDGFFTWLSWKYEVENYRCGNLQRKSAPKKPAGITTYDLSKRVVDGKTVSTNYSWWAKPIAPPKCPVSEELDALYEKMYKVYNSEDTCVAIEYRDSDLTEVKKRLQISAKHGMKVYDFFGLSRS